ncbi:cation diffusion facilitator family transporter [Thermovibrio ammonificans]|jgi:cation diffusion facilitator family transporter|uniref:Cation diffusion facilitator family transporter n=1 Tax=Thermovibrio ammonificans (strain DSM 15698 / JCM 12110 / HB-1) TaxID=648996 RepID=E8T3D6_THEA1|nr:cation diffusion facilitator family transporter [Thermovibrio ammonificans]ADU97268.1 cation diffusion facilitator family transporter [Thermovibrio ammonificans HB-1]
MELVSEKKRIALYSVLVNLFLSVLKIVAGIVSGSAALVADGIHSLADLAAAVSVLAGIVIANMKVEGFPYGLYKVENMISLVSAFAIFFAGYEIARDVLFSSHPPQMKNLPVALGAVVVTIVVTYLFSRYERKKGEELNSPSLIADSEHVKTDMLSSIVVLVGVLANYFGLWWLEKLAVLVIVVLIFHAGYEIMVEALKVLLDASIDRETLDKVKALLMSHPLVKKVKYVTGRSSGSYRFIEAEVVVATNDLEKAHRIVHEVEARVKNEVPFIEKIIIHFEPQERQFSRFAVPVDGDKVCSRFADCPEILILRREGESFSVEKRIPNPAKDFKFGKCIELVEFLAREGVDCIAVNNLPLGKGVIYALSSYDLGMKLVPVESVGELVEALKRDPVCDPPLVVWTNHACDFSPSGGSGENR